MAESSGARMQVLKEGEFDSNLRIPTEEDWGEYESDLDQAHAHKTFCGKSTQEAKTKFEVAVLERCEDLRFMPPIPFRYYIISFRDHVLDESMISKHSASDAACCFLELIISKLEEEPETIKPVLPDLMDAVGFLAENQLWYNADEDIYGSFNEKRIYIQQLLIAAVPKPV